MDICTESVLEEASCMYVCTKLKALCMIEPDILLLSLGL